MNDSLSLLLVGASSLVWVVCFIVVLIQMFQRGAAGLGIVCILLSLCCGVGSIVAFIYGWVKARQWNIMNLMIAWTVAWAICAAASAVNPAPFRQAQRIFEFK
jgi:hypothetical protein